MEGRKPRCKSISKLSAVAEQFTTQDSRCGPKADVMSLLQVCLDTLEAYKDEYKKMKSKDRLRREQLFEIYESAYVYYKIVHNLVLNRIPNLKEFHQVKRRTTVSDRKLMEIYNMLVKSLLYDERIAGVKNFLKENGVSEENLELKTGGFISAQNLEVLLNNEGKKILLIDVRQRSEFEECHIQCPHIICIEPISFKGAYTDAEVEKKSLITSPKQEIDLFKRRNEFLYIVLYTDGNGQNTHHNFYIQQEMVLLDLLENRSFAKPLGENTKLLVLEAGISSWRFHGGECTKSKAEAQQQHDGGAIYINGSTSGLNLQKLPKLAPNIGSSMDSSIKDMMRSSSHGHNNANYILPMQQKPSTKNLRAPNSSPSPSTSSSRPSSDLQFSSQMVKYANYPTTPRLVDNEKVSDIQHLTNVSPINSRAVTPVRRTLSPNPPRILTSSSASNGGTSGTSLSKPPNQPLPALPQLPTRSSHTPISSTQTKQYDLDFTVGLENMGNSCYMNCIIQCLLGTHELTNIFLNNSYERHINLNSKLGSKGVLAKHFARLIHQMHQNCALNITDKGKRVKPLQFKLACGSINSLFKESTQQDCQEFCQFLLDGLHEDLNQCGGNPPLKELSDQAEKMREKLSMRIASSIEWERYLTRDFSVIVDLFQGQYASQLRCKVCGHTSTTYQPFSILAAPVPRVKSAFLIDCFKEFTKTEQLEVDEEWSCPVCKKKQPSTKKLTITRLPRNLIIHLKRFDNMLNKNNVFVNYPFILDLTPFWANDFDGKLPPGVTEKLPSRGQVPPFKYKLYAVASHQGSLYGGHYTAYVDKGLSKGWYFFDDTGYRPVRNPTECITSNAYVLFYHRVYGV
ncbi:DOA4 (YDR069C) and UBP5 (YER144C) [Zygosaccharomyces parabailii]|uniref:Ubiquitin carboxyl-terminal hydrolase n=1 Tax=Zygosaccharomyces bailii (strain CLIB 213 / ATCC 58445 / CBS 680 / BCRC 21525 / NBRC 1098 / NCYC 1416 / NRRL Y-2227) TaxID=1333698 RepID=A0A8J2T8J0_ZYGB2|nr:DOA4 (YDR069C) and UBP5 (YER144C) [Zygosaccharomyces parabailii]CDF90066.1 ZYBA0S05-08218g1_1 [Zygosaccharomyces bailii CLIB 213]CDH15245.1 related to Ubiquitin carboxyl-terminal hydrolase 4 [Zygosaccharomyces bailii ISA1307]SJM87300.1 related to Ubiquitin carboxyl-terminal hydrolase 4 [Zygosaccharomyces bailii]